MARAGGWRIVWVRVRVLQRAHFSFEWKARVMIDRRAGWRWWFAIGNENDGGKEKIRVQVAGHFKDVVLWWIRLGWRTWDEKWPGVEKGLRLSQIIIATDHSLSLLATDLLGTDRLATDPGILASIRRHDFGNNEFAIPACDICKRVIES